MPNNTMNPHHMLVQLTVAELDQLIERKLAGHADRPLTSSEAAEFLQVDVDTVLRWVKSGVIPGRKLGSEWRFVRSELLGACRVTGTTSSTDTAQQGVQQTRRRAG